MGKTPAKPSRAKSTPRPTPAVRPSRPGLRPVFIFAILYPFLTIIGAVSAADASCSRILCAADDTRHFEDACAGVRALDGLIELAGVNPHQIIRNGHDKAIQAAWRWPIQILAIHVVVRAMAGTLEADAIVAERHFAAEMHTDLIQRGPPGVIAALHPIRGADRIGEWLT